MLSLFSRLKLKTRLQLSFLFIGFLSVVGISWQAFEYGRTTIETITFERLTSIREIKKRQIESYFHQIRNQAITLSEDLMIREAMKRYNEAFFRMTENQRITISRNAPSLNEPEAIRRYRQVDTLYHPIIENYCRRFGYDDLYLVDVDSGYVVFSVIKKHDFATDLIGGPYRKTGLAKGFQGTRATLKADSVMLIDFNPYIASQNTPASFIASPIVANEKILGVLVFQIPIALINEVMTSNNQWQSEGLGTTGETYIVGADYRMRTDSRFFIQSPNEYFSRLKKTGTPDSLINQIKKLKTSILLQEVKTEATRDALTGATNTKIITDYRGVPVLSSYTPLNIPGVEWVMVSEIDVSEAFGSVLMLRERLILLGLGILFASAFIGVLVARAIAKPIRQLAHAADQFGNGNFSSRSEVGSNDEIGLLSTEFNSMAESIEQNTARLQNEIAERKRAEEEVRLSHQQLRNLSAHLQTVREEERKGLAREIHDELGQALTTLKLHLTVLKGDLHPVSTDASEKISPLLLVIDSTIKSVKRMIVALRPRLLDDLGFTAAIEWQVEEFQQRTGISCRLTMTPHEILLDADRSIALFRIFQETLTNIARHANATSVQITIIQNDSQVQLCVADNGIGMTEEQSQNSTSFGLMGIRERASYWGGDTHIQGIMNKGTTVIVRIPYQSERMK